MSYMSCHGEYGKFQYYLVLVSSECEGCESAKISLKKFVSEV